MELPKLLILLCCICYSLASHHSHTIPVEGYDTELQDLGEHVDHHETPVKVIKITKTIAVKVPVPYPVKVIQKVPYPVHINKPYPVPVPHIVKVPQPIHKHAHEPADASGYQGEAYNVHQAPSQDSGNGNSFGLTQGDSYNGGGQGHNVESYAEEHPSDGGYSRSSYDAPSNTYYGSSGTPEDESFEAKSYDQAIQAFWNKNNPSGANSFH